MKEKVINVKEWWKKEGKPKREYDAKIAEKIFGYKVLGWAYCDGDLIYPKEYSVETVIYNPVYLKKCRCSTFINVPSSKKFFGHYGWCMAEVPHYSTCIEDAWLIVDKLIDDCTFSLEVIKDGIDDNIIWQCVFGDVVTNAETPMLAICKAALLIKDK